MKTLLVLIKHPNTSEKFLKYAFSFAEDMNMHVRALYVVDPVEYPVGASKLSGQVAAKIQHDLNYRIKESGQQLRSMLAEFSREKPAWQNVEVGTFTGKDVRIINELVNEQKIHMVMIRNLNDDLWFRDSRERAIAREAKCPVWVIPEDAEYGPFRRVLYTTDYNEEDIPNLNKLIDLTHAHDPEITALHVTEDVDFELRIKNAGFQKILEMKTGYSDIRVKALVPQHAVDPMELVKSYAERIQADLLVVLQENHSFMDRFFGKDHAARVLREAKRPVLLYHESGSDAAHNNSNQ